MRFSEHSSSELHREVFEHVRKQLGQMMIASPLPLEELMGILIMSLWASSPSVSPVGTEYVEWHVVVADKCIYHRVRNISIAGY